MWIAVAGVYLFHIWLLNRAGGGYAGNAEEMLELMGDSPPSPPPLPGKPQLPPSGTPADRSGEHGCRASILKYLPDCVRSPR
jgi:hypothetical protein